MEIPNDHKSIVSNSTNTTQAIIKWTEIEAAICNAPLCAYLPDGIIKIIVDNCFNWHWDKSMSFGIDLEGNNCELSHYNEDIRKVGAPHGWQTTRGNICLNDTNGYIYEWDIIAVNFHPAYGDIIIGILSDDGQKPTSEDYDHGFVDKCEVWAYHSSNRYSTEGFTVHQYSSRDFGGAVDHDKALDEPFGSGDIITVIYNSKLKTLKFKKNGKQINLSNMDVIYEDKQNEDTTVIYEAIKGDIFPFVTVYSEQAKAKLSTVKYYKL